MPKLPASINGVTVVFGSKVNRTVKQSLINGLKHCIKTKIATSATLNKIYISSASDQHKLPSRHAQDKAVDISRINGTKIVLGYPKDADIKAIVDAIQDTFETYSGRRENYGPKFKKKSGKPNTTVKDHKDHIHLSVN
jgi:hypothetical protein